MNNFRKNNFSGKHVYEQRASRKSEPAPPFNEPKEEDSPGTNAPPGDDFTGDDQQHLILRHNQSGDLFYSKIPDRLSVAHYFDNTDLHFQLKMPSESVTQLCFWRWLLTLLHGITCLVSGFCFIYSLIGTIFSDHCLPYVVNKDGSFIKSHFGFSTFCEGVLYGLGFVFVFSFGMCGLVQCSLNRTWLMVLSLFLTTCMVGCSAVGGSMFTIHFAIWCDSISQSLGTTHTSHVRCADAAAKFDLLHKGSDMRTFAVQMDLQQISSWSLFPLTFVTLLCYALAMHWGQAPASSEDVPPPRGFYQYLATGDENGSQYTRPQSDECDERSPFLNTQE